MLAIDIGGKRSGLAISSPDGKFVFGKGIVPSFPEEDFFATIDRLCRAESIVRIIVGLPLHANGRRGDDARRIALLADRMHEKTGVEIVFEDERLSTAFAKRLRAEAGKTGHDDEDAARVILEGYIERLSFRKT
jgi:putative Holliday junction resolvase